MLAQIIGGWRNRSWRRRSIPILLATIVLLAGCDATAVIGSDTQPVSYQTGASVTTIDLTVESEVDYDDYAAFFGEYETSELFKVWILVDGVPTEAQVVDAEFVESSGDFTYDVTLTVAPPYLNPGTYDVGVGFYVPESAADYYMCGGGDPECESYYAPYRTQSYAPSTDGDLILRDVVELPGLLTVVDDERLPPHVDVRTEWNLKGGHYDDGTLSSTFQMGVADGELLIEGGNGSPRMTVDVWKDLPKEIPAPDGEVVEALEVRLDGRNNVDYGPLTLRIPVHLDRLDTDDPSDLTVQAYDAETGEWNPVTATVHDEQEFWGYHIVTLEVTLEQPGPVAVTN